MIEHIAVHVHLWPNTSREFLLCALHQRWWSSVSCSRVHSTCPLVVEFDGALTLSRTRGIAFHL